MTYFIKLKIF